jgi:hypothetical protein
MQGSPSHRIRLVTLLALWMSLVGRVPAAIAADAPSPEFWSIQLHGGLFAGNDVDAGSPMVGMRYCKRFSPHLQGGLLTGWTSMSESLEQPADGSVTYDPQVELVRVDAGLLPVMGFLQVNLTEKFFLVPFLGIGGGYEWLIIDMLDNRTGLETHATYASLAWETFGGAGLRLNSKVQLNGELFYNGGRPGRNIIDESGHTWVEAIRANGVGVRVGLDMVFE